MRLPFSNMKLIPRFMLFMGIALNVPLICLALLVFRSSEALLQQLVLENFSHDIRLLVNHMDGFLGDQSDNLRLIHQTQSLNQYASGDLFKKMSWRTEVEKLFINLQGISGEFQQIRFINRDGMEEVKVDNKVGRRDFVSIKDSILFERLSSRHGEEMVILFAHGTIYFGLPKYHPMYSDELLGYLVGDLALTSLLAKFTEATHSQSGQSMLIDHQGRILSQPTAKDDFASIDHLHLTESVSAHLISQDLAPQSTITDDGSELFIVSRQLQRIPWSVVLMVPAEQVMTPVNEMLQTVLYVSLFCLSVALLVGFMIVRHIAFPIVRLAQVADQMARDPTHEPNLTEVSCKDELGMLAASFSMMVRKIQGYSGNLEELVARRTQALQESERRLADTQRIARLGSWEFEVDTQQITWSAETFRIAGMSVSDQSPTLAEYQATVHPEDLPLLNTCVERAITKQEPYEAELRHRQPNGTYNSGLPHMKKG